MLAMNPLGSDYPPIEAGFADGALWTFRCRACGFENGGFVECERNKRSSEEKDPYSPLNRPCVNCGQRPVEWQAIGQADAKAAQSYFPKTIYLVNEEDFPRC